MGLGLPFFELRAVLGEFRYTQTLKVGKIMAPKPEKGYDSMILRYFWGPGSGKSPV